jgi:hypothetical protein
MAVAPTLLSTFEVLFTPQLPTGIPVPNVVRQIDEDVVKGYFLTISNPNATGYLFSLGFHCNTNPAMPPPERTLVKAVGFLDDGTTAIPATLSAGTLPTDFFVSVNVAARGTVLLGIIPAFFNSAGFVNPSIDCRGWVDVTLPPIFKRFGRFFILVPQSADPVPIIVTPEQRLTFIPAPGDAATAVEAQSAFALPVAGGSSSLSVPPQPAFVFTSDELKAAPDKLSARLSEQMAMVPPPERLAMLSALVAASPAVAEGKRKPEEILRELGFGDS